jgi:hypothetical protein
MPTLPAKVEFPAPVTFPVRLAVIVPAEKLPDASLKTIVDAVLVLDGFPANLLLDIPAEAFISASTIAPFAIIVPVIEPLGSVMVPVAVRYVQARPPFNITFPEESQYGPPVERSIGTIVPFAIIALVIEPAGSVRVPVAVRLLIVPPLISGAVKVLLVSVCIPLIVTIPVPPVSFNALIM